MDSVQGTTLPSQRMYYRFIKPKVGTLKHNIEYLLEYVAKRDFINYMFLPYIFTGIFLSFSYHDKIHVHIENQNSLYFL